MAENESAVMRPGLRNRTSEKNSPNALDEHVRSKHGYGLGFESQTGETRSDQIEVVGDVPDWLCGSLLRVAPAKFEVGDQRYNHWFDGLAKLHKFSFANGSVGYASRFLRSNAFCEAERENRIARGEFATDPCRGLFGRLATIFRGRARADNANINVDVFGGDVVALTEGSPPTRFDADTLETLGIREYPDAVSRGRVSTAHPHQDLDKRRQYSYVVEFGRHSHYRIFTLDQAGRSEVLAEYPVDRPCYMHSFGMSERCFILAEFPLCVNPLRLRFSDQPFIRNYRWRPDRGLKFRLFDRHANRWSTVEAEAAFGFHHVNAFDDGDHVILDVVTYPDASVIDQFCLNHLKSGAPVEAAGRLTRYRLPIAGGSASTPERVSDALFELPRTSPLRQRRADAIVYGAGVMQPGNFFDSILKIKPATGDTLWWHEPDCYPGEPVFVPAPNARTEDEGVVLSVVLDPARRRSFLLVLNGTDMSERARALVPEVISFGFHGNFFPDSAAA